MKKNNALLALTAAATCLPGIPAKAQQIAEDYAIGVKYHKYEEDGLSEDKVINPVYERYDIEVNQFRLVAPIAEDMELNVNYQYFGLVH